MSLNRLVAAAALVMALVLAALPMPAARAGDYACVATDPLCFDALPRDDAWERAIRLPAVPNWWEGDDVTVASIDTGVTPNPTSAAGCAPAWTSRRPRRHRPLRPRDAHRRADRQRRHDAPSAPTRARRRRPTSSRSRWPSWDGATDVDHGDRRAAVGDSNRDKLRDPRGQPVVGHGRGPARRRRPARRRGRARMARRPRRRGVRGQRGPRGGSRSRATTRT